MPRDRWADRSTHVCGTCLWFMRKGASSLGRCRRHAPTLGGWRPVVFDDDFCGDHKLDEDKSAMAGESILRSPQKETR